jgi:hypothetical protein
MWPMYGTYIATLLGLAKSIESNSLTRSIGCYDLVWGSNNGGLLFWSSVGTFGSFRATPIILLS